VIVAVGNEAIWRRFCHAVALPQLADDARFATNRDRLAHYGELRALLAKVIAARPRQEWIDRLRAAEVPCGSVRDVAEVLNDPQLAARQMIAELVHPTVGPMSVMGSPLKLSQTPATVRTPPPMLGEHTESILGELGYDREAIVELKAAGVI
jgi:crotonobetainyl-CoA:carnitine CoA-transferase CaiB-like acyl-CoA transferase